MLCSVRKSFLWLVAALFVCGCSKGGQDRLENKKGDVLGQTSDSIQHEPQKPLQSEKGIQKKLKEFLELVAFCDRQFFADIDPERIKKWVMVVDAQQMEKECDPMLARFSEILQEKAFCGDQWDGFLRSAARLCDLYVLLCLKARKVSLKERKPYMEEVAQLKEAIRTASAEVNEKGELLLRDPSVFDTQPSTDAEYAVQWLKGLCQAFDEHILKNLKEAKPIPRYALKLHVVGADRAIEALEKSSDTNAQRLLGSAMALNQAFSKAMNIFTGDYFKVDEKVIRQTLRDFEVAKIEFTRVWIRFWKKRLPDNRRKG